MSGDPRTLEIGDDPSRDAATVQAYADEVGLSALLDEASGSASPTGSGGTSPFGPDLRDLVRLHHLVRARRVVPVLDYGSGWSTLAIAHALSLNEAEFGETFRAELPRANPFQIHFVDNMHEFIEATLARIPKRLRPMVFALETEVAMTTFASRICTEYVELPNICPDFVYLDAPSLFDTRGHVNGIGMDNPDRLPMSCDLLKVEHFLLPGTMVLVDGRTANARFLRCNLQRNWHSSHDPDADLSVFELREPPLGPFNRRQIELCLGAGWLDQIGS